jgi:hypothetical protein
MTAPRTFAIVGVGLAIIGAVGTTLVRYVYPVPVVGAFGFGEAATLGYVIEGLTWASIGALLVTRRPQNAVGWLMVLVGTGYALSQLTVSLTFAYAAEGTAQGERLAQVAGWVTVLLQLVAILQLGIGFLFPTGRVQSPGWGRFMRLFWAVAIVFVVTSLTQPGPLQLLPAVNNPLGFGPDLRDGRPIAPILAAATMVLFASLASSMVSRYRSAGHVERQQLKWFVLALGLSAIGLGIATWEAVFTDGPDAGIGLTVYVFAGAVVPVAIGIAILRYRLYEIDRLISRTVTWSVVSSVLVLTFAVAVVALQAILARFTQGQTLAVAGSTLVAFALFQPLRRQVQSVVDRRFDRARYDAERTAVAFGARIRDQVDLAGLEADITETVLDALRPRSASVWVRTAGPEETR